MDENNQIVLTTAAFVRSSTSINCGPPSRISALNGTYYLDVTLDLASGEYTHNRLKFEIVACAGDCSGHGVCSNQGLCSCEYGWGGVDCGTACPTDPVTSKMCAGHGACRPDTGECQCDSGWGPHNNCSTETDCDWENDRKCTCPQPGVGGAHCSEGCATSGPDESCATHGICDRSLSCICREGWFGFSCAAACPAGTSYLACSGVGTCTDDGECECDVGKAGRACELSCPNFEGQNCAGHGDCDEHGVCVCYPGYRGTDCNSKCPGTTNPGQPDAVICSGHGVCGANGCECVEGWYGTGCREGCPGAPDNICSGHGTCGGSLGKCQCDAAWWGSGCESECPGTVGDEPCNGHGECNAATGKCACWSPYAGESCSSTVCPHDCYGHGRCVDGNCHCDAKYLPPDCSERAADPLTITIVTPFVTVNETVGTVCVNVSLRGVVKAVPEHVPQIGVQVDTVPYTAREGSDFMPVHERIWWNRTTLMAVDEGGEGVFAVWQCVYIEVLNGAGRPEEVEYFEVTLSKPFPSVDVIQFGPNPNASIALEAHDAPDTAPGTVSVVVQLTTPARSIQPGSPAGEAFVENFREDLGRADVLAVTTDRVLVHSISASSGGSRVMFYLIEASAAMVRGMHTETQQSAVQLAALFVTLVANTTSPLYAGKATRAIDPAFEPIIKVLGPSPIPPTHEPSGGSAVPWIVALVVVVTSLLMVVAVGVWKRKPLSEWLLWRLGNFRFRKLRDPNAADGNVADEIDDNDL